MRQTLHPEDLQCVMLIRLGTLEGWPRSRGQGGKGCPGCSWQRIEMSRGAHWSQRTLVPTWAPQGALPWVSRAHPTRSSPWAVAQGFGDAVSSSAGVS